MKYCQSCIIPNSRPNVSFDENGVCYACLNFKKRPTIDWKAREAALGSIFNAAKAKSNGYDCLVPVSGGKDSTWQILQCLEYGLNPLAVTWKAPSRTEIGRKNLENLISLGVDHIDYQVNPKVEKKFLLKSLKKYGTTALPMHLALHNIPLRLAVQNRIPLVVWGENSAFEYGNAEEMETGFNLDAEWKKKYGVTHGTTAEDWLGPDLSRKELTAYWGPDDSELEAAGISAIFLGFYLPWDPLETFRVAKENGFSEDKSGPRVGFYDFADIDDDFISIHHFLKWYKFGFTRHFDNLSLEIRHGRISRQQAIEVLEEAGEKTPEMDILRFCEYVGISREDFSDIVEPFRNTKIWKKENGVWKIPEFLVKNWKWS